MLTVIVVAGTMRSGTSMWMQVLRAAGFQVVGDAFPEPWGERLRNANPRGFYESRLLSGIYFGTNPDPDSGAYLHPHEARDLAVKVFIPGLVRTDIAYLDRVIATVRPWRQYAASVARLRTMDADGMREIPESPVSPAVEWFLENFALIRDVALRGYPAHVTTYDRVLRDPEAEIREAVRWLGRGDWRPAVRQVEPELRSQHDGVEVEAAPPEDLDDEALALLDDLYAALDGAGALPASLVDRLNRLEADLRPRVLAARAAARDAWRHLLLTVGPLPAVATPESRP